MAGPELCTWTEFSLTDVELLIGCSGNRERLQKVLCEKLCLDTSSKQDLILLDLYIYSFLFGMKQAFTAAQISTLLSIVKRLHLMCIGTVFDNYTEVLTYFQELIVLHSVNRPPFSISVFSPSHAKKINEYILTTYFKHYKMYKYAFTKKVHLNLSLSWSGEDVESEVAEVDNNLIETQTSPETTDHLLEKEAPPSEEGGDGDGKEDEEEVEPGRVHLNELISNGLSKILEQEQERVRVALSEQESRLTNRIGALEATLQTKRTNSGKKKK